MPNEVTPGGTALLKIGVPPDRFSATNSKTYEASRSIPNVRRPTSGITLRDDTFASLRVVSGSGANMKVIDAGSRLMGGVDGKQKDQPLQVKVGSKTYTANDTYSNFLLQNITEERQEKAQVLETFGEPYIFLYGERPRILNCQGILLNTFDFNWEAEWWENYDNFLRGTRCVEKDARVYLAFDNTLVGGYILSANAQKQGQERNFVQFQFQLFVTYYESFSNLGNPYVTGGIGATGRDVNEAAFAPGRPTWPINPNTDRVVVDPLTGKVLTEASFNSAVAMAEPSTLAQAWRGLQQATRSVLSTVSQVWEGEVVRVPDDFSGAFAYGDSDHLLQPFQLPSVKELSGLASQVVKYTTFSKNDDEYVGTSSHYGSADLRFSPTSESAGLSGAIEAANVTSAKIDKYLLSQGIVPGGGLATTLSKMVKTARAALVVVNSVQSFAGLAKHGVSPATPNLTGSVYDWSDHYGGALKRSTDNAYPE